MLRTVGAQEADVERAGEVLAELVAGRHLQRLAVTHHRLEGQGVGGAGEPLLGGLPADEHGYGEHRGHEVQIDLEVDAPGVRGRVRLVDMRGVPLLPEELARAQEKPGAQLPPDDVRPLVEQQWEVPVALRPLRHVLADDGLAGRPDHYGLFQLLAAAVGDDGELGAEALDVLGLPAEVAFGDEQRKVGVDRSGRLDPGVHVGLHPFPDRVAVRSDDHGPADRAVVGQFRLGEHILVPAGEVLAAGSKYGHPPTILPDGAGSTHQASRCLDLGTALVSSGRRQAWPGVLSSSPGTSRKTSDRSTSPWKLTSAARGGTTIMAEVRSAAVAPAARTSSCSTSRPCRTVTTSASGVGAAPGTPRGSGTRSPSVSIFGPPRCERSNSDRCACSRLCGPSTSRAQVFRVVALVPFLTGRTVVLSDA